ncbi:MAG: dicarboxylate/amino acid:cation symporter [Ignavibacteriales bacterium]|nr:MAG: dicarboxylate/amino acid:cation symporter [Ignavibacteriales bacterium]
MKIKIPKLHNQILIALILGAIFGSIFSVKKNSLVVSFQNKDRTDKIVFSDWKQFQINVIDRDTVVFFTDQQLEILSYVKKAKQNNYPFDVRIRGVRLLTDKDAPPEIVAINKVISVDRERTIPSYIKWVGDIFIRLLNMIAIPLVLASLIVGAASLGDIRKFMRIGGKTIAFYIGTTAFAITTGLLIANLLQPGHRMAEDSKSKLLAVYSEDVAGNIEKVSDYDFTKEIVNLVPRNPFAAIAGSEMLQIVFFALLVGLTLSLIAKDKSSPVLSFFDGLSEAMIKLVDIIMLIAPIGVFALISATVSEFGFEILETLIWYAVAVIAGLLIHTVLTYSLLLKIFTKMKIFFFFKGIRRAQAIAFSTSSSAATLPVNMECCQENLGVPKSITSFILPLGATINMDGTALYQGVAAVFIAQVFGIDLTFTQQLIIVFTAVLASIGTAPVPGVGIIMLVIILKSVGIPEEGIALILGIDRILDMSRTVTNVTGDALTAVVISSSEKGNGLNEAELKKV